MGYPILEASCDTQDNTVFHQRCGLSKPQSLGHRQFIARNGRVCPCLLEDGQKIGGISASRILQPLAESDAG